MSSVTRFAMMGILAAVLFPTGNAQALEKVKVATTFLGLWDTSQPTFCKQRGEFEKAGLDVEITSTRGGAESVLAVVTGGVDISYSPGTDAVLAAFQKGSDIKIIGSEFTGQAGAFFYVPAESPIKTIADLNGKSMAFSRPGGAMETLVLAIRHDNNLNLKPVAAGAIDATYTQVMTKQIDVGYSVVPSLLDKVNDGTLRILIRSDEIPSQQGMTGRVNIVSGQFLRSRRETAVKFMETLDRCVDWAFENMDQSSKMYAEMNKITPEIAAKSLSFYTREQLAFGPLLGFDKVVDMAVREKFITAPPTPQQQKDLIDIVYTTHR